MRATGGPARLIPPSYARVVGLDARDVLYDAFAIGGPHVDPEGEMRPRYRHPLLPPILLRPELYLAVEDIDHSRTKTKSPRFHIAKGVSS